MAKVSKYFTESELMCSCCHTLNVSTKLLATLDAIREYIGKPVRVVSGYRCIAHNKAVGSKIPRGPIVTGKQIGRAHV